MRKEFINFLSIWQDVRSTAGHYPVLGFPRGYSDGLFATAVTSVTYRGAIAVVEIEKATVKEQALCGLSSMCCYKA